MDTISCKNIVKRFGNYTALNNVSIKYNRLINSAIKSFLMQKNNANWNTCRQSTPQ